MNRGTRLATIAAAGALAVAVPAAAKPAHPTHPAHPSHPSTSHKCTAHNEAYTASGTLVSFDATQTGHGTYTGTVTVHVTKINHHAASDKGMDKTYTLNNAKVRFGKGANPPTAGDPVKVIGRISELGKRCDQTGFTPTVTVRKLDIRTARPKS